MNKITLTFPYYCQPLMFDFQMRHLKDYPGAVKSNLELIVVDDCSPENPLKIPTDTGIKSRFFRTGVDVPWNIPFCRNLAASQAEHDWILFTDIDHIIPPQTLAHLMEVSLDPSKVYWLNRARYETPDILEKRHGNTILIHKSLRDKLGGDDERLAAIYSAQEVDFKRRSQEIAEWVVVPYKIFRVDSSVVKDSKVRLERQSEAVYALRDMVITNRNKVEGWKPITLSFKWSEIGIEL